MDLSWWLLNLAYAVYVISPVFKEMLKLRLVLLAATVLFIAYGISSGVDSVTWWNIPFGLMHIYQIGLLLKERMNGDLPEELERVREMLFPDLSAVDFRELWDLGHESKLQAQGLIIENGEDLSEVMLIIDGAADVHLDDGGTLRLRPYTLLGEMSLVRGGPASATVTAAGPTTIRSWDRVELLKLGDRKPHVKQAALLLIGQQLAQKMSTEVPKPAALS